jgi:hypothetical protein
MAALVIQLPMLGKKPTQPTLKSNPAAEPLGGVVVGWAGVLPNIGV